MSGESEITNYQYICSLTPEKMADVLCEADWCDSGCALDSKNYKCENCITKWLKSQRSIGQSKSDDSEKEYTDTELEKLWEDFWDVPMNPETEVMTADFLHFSKGTHREEIWKWFDSKHSKGVHFLLYKGEDD